MATKLCSHPERVSDQVQRYCFIFYNLFVATLKPVPSLLNLI
jgi:hypothetical protein